MHNKKSFGNTAQFRRRFSVLSHILWLAVLMNALYIAAYVLAFFQDPAGASVRGLCITAVPDMMEHILMSILLLTGCGALEESVVRFR